MQGGTRRFWRLHRATRIRPDGGQRGAAQPQRLCTLIRPDGGGAARLNRNGSVRFDPARPRRSPRRMGLRLPDADRCRKAAMPPEEKGGYITRK